LHNLVNKTQDDHSLFKQLADDFMPYAQEYLGYDKPVDLELVSDPKNAKDPLGKTAYYDPNNMRITIFVDKRHVKDMLRSLGHELVHHAQNCRGEFNRDMNVGEGYAQNDAHLRSMEEEAYRVGGGFLIRDWEDQFKLTEGMISTYLLKRTSSGKEKKTMSSKRKFKVVLTEGKKGKKKVKHSCASHVKENITGRRGKCINHTLNESGRVSHYTVEFKDVIIENIPVSALTVLKENMHEHMTEREDYTFDENLLREDWEDSPIDDWENDMQDAKADADAALNPGGLEDDMIINPDSMSPMAGDEGEAVGLPPEDMDPAMQVGMEPEAAGPTPHPFDDMEEPLELEEYSYHLDDNESPSPAAGPHESLQEDELEEASTPDHNDRHAGRAAGGRRIRVAENKSHWTRGNKEELLFERLTKKWCK